MKPQTTSRRINDPGIIAACHYGAEYETEYSASIETHTETSIDSAQQKSTDRAEKESVDINQGEWENDYYNPTMAAHNMHTEEYDEDYEEERAIEQRAILDEEDRLLHHSSWKRKSPSIGRNGSTSIDTQPHQPNHLRASTDIAYYTSIDTNDDATRDGYCSIRSWTDDRHHESYAVETAYRDQGVDELHEVPVDFHVLDIKLNWNSSLLLGRAFLSTVGAVCNLQTNRLCLTLIDPHVHYHPILVKKPQTTPRRINDLGIIAACHCGAEYETEYSASIETHTATSIDSAQQKSTDGAEEDSVDCNQGEWENDYYNPTAAAHNMHTEEYDEDYKEERAIEQRAILDEEDRLLHHSSWKKKLPSIDRNMNGQHRSTLNFINQTTFEHRPTSPTTHRSTLKSTLPETEITQLEVGQMIAITRATQ
ncbi:hypothetical protein DY000_02006568 [Brassica cretica]|uniref:Uncharacterized protein n=1 Tax=Brassica cretica TaxID=69181 RepID=A0ABQ7BYB4_BRACR|nr:hypothetical protein DY000_02006568 [Brassica cretica]